MIVDDHIYSKIVTITIQFKVTNILMIKVIRTDRRRAKEMQRNGFLDSEYAHNILGKVQNKTNSKTNSCGGGEFVEKQ